MDLLIKKMPPSVDYDVDTVDFTDFSPDLEVISKISPKYTSSFADQVIPFDDEVDAKGLQELLDTLDPNDPGALYTDEVTERLEELGYLVLGTSYTIEIPKDKKVSDYVLYATLDDPADNLGFAKGTIFSIAVSRQKKFLEAFLENSDKETIMFKVKQIVKDFPEKSISLKELIDNYKSL